MTTLKQGSRTRATGAAWAALLAVLFHLAFPAAVSPGAAAANLVAASVCTDHGVETVYLDLGEAGKGQPSRRAPHCPDCTLAGAAAAPSASPFASPVRYQARVAHTTSEAAAPPEQARPPPRPPSQAPPA